MPYFICILSEIDNRLKKSFEHEQEHSNSEKYLKAKYLVLLILYRSIDTKKSIKKEKGKIKNNKYLKKMIR